MYCAKCGTLIDEDSCVCKACGETYGDIVSKKQSAIEKFKVAVEETSEK